MTDLTKLAPCEVWTEFEAITRVPRPSKKEEKIRDYLVGWAKEHGLEYRCDATGNVVIRKPATTGYEGRPTVILQSHMDMVCEKNSDVAFDFEHDAIRTRIDDGWVRAEGTTLGADDGIGMAAALAMLASATVAHPALEALFTVDEETGLTGAFGLGEGMLTGKYLINLDSEDEGELFIGCAGGVDTVAKFSPMVTPAPDGFEYFRIDVKGLAGGHSGDDIEKGRANSNKLVARLLYELLPYGPVLNRFDGGNLRNAIPREAFAVFGVPAETAGDVCERCRAFAVEIVEEFKYTEPNLQMTLNIDELDIDNVEVGQTVNITSDAKEGQTFTGVVTKVSVVGTTSGGTTTYPVTVRIDDTEGLRPGMNVDAEIVLTSADDVLAIPGTAVNRGNTVLITSDSPSAANALEQEAPEGYVYVQVETGVSDDSYIEVTSGLQEGDTVAYLRTASSGSGNMMMGGMPSDMGGGMGGGMPSGGMPSGGPGGGF